MDSFNITNKKQLAQTKFCTNIGQPKFVLTRCPSCNGDPLERYSIEQCTKQLITSCSMCNHSFVS